ncbi:MAG: zinc-dependent metalloprotease [Pirellulaceae bacterium]|nr:zinc-dependent metalloprotease [Planctomycetales bacterium]
MKLTRYLALPFAFALAMTASLASADDAAKPAAEKPTEDSTVAAEAGGGAAQPEHAAILKEAKPFAGMFKAWQKEQKLFVELSPADYNNEYIVLISIARGIGQRPLLGGYSWGFGDDWIWKFRKIGDTVHVIRRNVRFKANKGTPEATAVQFAYSDSVLFALPVVSKGPGGGDLVDFTQVFMGDLPQISQVLPGFMFSPQKSYWESIKAFDGNMELTVAATYQSGGSIELDSVADSRGVTINVHYSISKLPSTGYEPRLADDRVGYFLTVVKDYSDKTDREQFVRYVNRWHLEKPPGAGDGPTPPKEPIIFWIEKTVPFAYRKPIREGIEEWNKAFEKAGWLNAIEVRQQPDDADWDPEDIRYNTFRWITSDAGFAMGPSRVNPYTGQILDADIIFDADFLKFWKSEFETLEPKTASQMLGQPTGETLQLSGASLRMLGLGNHSDCALSNGMAHQMAYGATALVAQAEGDPAKSAAEQERLIMQGLKEVTMHEVGHTLGLRHNFKASKLYGLKDLNDPEKVRETGLVASVMDYSPVNIVPKDWKQGDYYTTTIGPYDYWAIEYGYKDLPGPTAGERGELNKIASRSGEPALTYATDEDTVPSDPDPDSNRFDLGNDSLEYARVQAQLVKELMPGLVERMSKEGDDYTQVRRAFNVLLAQHGQAMAFAARNVGGLHTSRSHKGDKDAKPPVTPVDAKKQRDTLELLQKEVFAADAYNYPPEIYAFLASTNWRHWGSNSTNRKDFPFHDFILMWQTRTLDGMISSTNLQRIADTEAKTPPDQDVLTNAELLERLSDSIFSELDTVKEGEFTARKPAISSLRRNLQRSMLERLANFAMGRATVPNDVRAIAYAELSSLKDGAAKLLGGGVKLDPYSRAHLEEMRRTIEKVEEASLTLARP